MLPTLFKIGPFTINSWGVMVAIAIVIGLYLATHLASKKGISKDDVFNVGFYVVLAGLIGGRLIFVLLDFPYYAQNPIDIIMIQQGGMSIQGSLLGGFIAGYLYCRHAGLPFLKVADVFAPALLLGQGIGRVGCFLGGHCEGTVTNFFLKVKFPMLEGFRHPVQLYETSIDLIAFALVMVFLKKFKKDGTLFATSIIIISAVRFALDFVREAEILFLGLSWAQVFSLGTIAVFTGYLIIKSKKIPSEYI